MSNSTRWAAVSASGSGRDRVKQILEYLFEQPALTLMQAPVSSVDVILSYGDQAVTTQEIKRIMLEIRAQSWVGDETSLSADPQHSPEMGSEVLSVTLTINHIPQLAP